MEQIKPSHKRSVFSDPFGRDPPPKAFYHPSRHRQLKNKERKITLSPNRPDSNPSKRLTQEEELFLKGTNTYATRTSPNKDDSGDHSSQFDESWPTSERPSYTSVIDSDNGHEVSGRPSDMMEALSYLKSTYSTSGIPTSLADRDPGRMSNTKQELANKGSVLQSYIERFRHGQPMSREERRQADASNKPDFWWLSQSPPTPSDTSTPKDDANPRSKQFTDQGRQRSQDLGGSKGSSSVPLTTKTLAAFSRLAIDEDTKKLQEKADRLLEESMGSLHSSEPAVSTDGLGVTSSGTGSSFDEVPYRPVFTRRPDPKFSAPKHEFTIPKRPQKPEDDILYQWRLRRKIEVAQRGSPSVKVAEAYASKNIESKLDRFRQRVGSVVNPLAEVRSSSALHFTPTPQKQSDTKVDAEVQTQKSVDADSKCKPNDTIEQSTPPSTPPRQTTPSKPQIASPTLPRTKDSTTEPHLHLMCDLLPCPHSEKYSKQYPELYGNSSQFSDSGESPTETKHVRYRQYLPAEKPHSEEKRGRKEKKKKHDQDFENEEIAETLDERKHVSGNRPESDTNTSSDIYESERSGPDRKETDQARMATGKGDNSATGKGDKSHDSKTDAKRVSVKLDKGRQSNMDNDRTKRGMSNVDHGLGHMSVSSKSKHGAPRPVHSSSPGKPGQSVSSAIGQTISEHLFDRSVMSSVDSWASLTDQSQLPSTPLVTSSQPPGQPGANSARETDVKPEDENYESDGEFPDDHILKMLRQQREEYEIKLRQIDELLQQSSFGQK